MTDPLAEWSRRHGDYDVARSRVVRWWLQLVATLSAPLVRVPPDAISAAGVATAVAAIVAPRRAAAGLVLATGVLDGVDGAVARRRDVASRHGAFVDTAADRLTDVLFLLALRRRGARRPLVFVAAAGVAALELQRALARRRGDPVAVVTPGERPFRVAYAALGLAFAPSLGAAAIGGTTVAGGLALYRERRQR
ncbi:MAG: archaetidylinositol phosphate synthase [Frankiaceae bacterium]|nr:archaetidylinositol phosphate synthase [Frankiaceae bacterium]